MTTRAAASFFPFQAPRSNFPHRGLRLLATLAALSLTSRALSAEESSLSPPKVLKKLSLEELMNIEVTSVARRPEKLLDAASAIQVVTNDDIRRSGASSIPEALRLADNLQIAQKNPHDWAISARGFNTALSNKLLVLIDGRTVYTPLFSGVFWDVQDYLLEDVDRIEVISGPGSALWGSNAVNGVINITSKSAADTQGLYLEAGGGSELKGFVGARYGGRLAPGVHYRVYVKQFERDSGVFASGTPSPNNWRMMRGGFRIDAQGTPQDALTLQSDIYDGDENLATGRTAHASGGNILGRWSHRTGQDAELALQLYYDRTRLSDPIPASAFAPAGTLIDTLDTYDLDLQHRFRASAAHEFVWGAEYRFTRDAVVNAPDLAFMPPKLDHDLFSGFVQDEIKLSPVLSLTLGSKLEHNDYTGWEMEPSGRLQWTLTSGSTLWTAVSRAVRIPSRVDRDIRRPVILTGSADFRSETIVAYELGYRAQVTPILSGSISAFYNDYDRVRSLTFTPATIVPLVFKNDLEGETYGFELSANFRVADTWRLHAGYNLLKEHLRIKPGGIDLNHALNETADPTSQVSLRSAFELSDTVELDVDVRWVDSFTINNGGAPAHVPAYTETNVRLGWRLTKEIELSLVGQNLLHRQHAEYGVPGAAQEQIQRGFYGKVTWRY